MTRIPFLGLLLMLGLASCCIMGCSDDCENTTTPTTTPPTDATYVGSDKCGECHETKHQEWEASGHPYKLTKIEGVAPATFPLHSAYPNDPVDPPVGLGWPDVTYTIGGYFWKMRFIDENGWIVTSGVAEDLVQYNFHVEDPEDGNWVTYHTGDERETKPYDCGKCHTTGWVANSDPTDLTGNQDGLAGMWGTFQYGGVHCEECHGKGSNHVASPSTSSMIMDNSSAMCGRCHTRDGANRIAASSGWVKHHEQYDEWLHSPHNLYGGPGCNDCHDPHASVVYDDETPGDGLKTSCTDCHDATEYALKPGAHSFAQPACTNCHMPQLAKSAAVNPSNPYDADVNSHILAIRTDAVGAADGMFTTDGKFVKTENGLARLTLDFACYSCHTDPNGDGGGGPTLTLQELSTYATGIHPNAKALARIVQK